MQLTTWLPIVVSICMFIVALLTLRRNKEADNTAEATERATLAADVRYIRTGVDEIKVENRTIRTDLDKLNVKVAEIDASCKSAHKRLDDLRKE